MTTPGANRKNFKGLSFVSASRPKKRGLSSVALAKEGFTMMELVVSIAIFCIVILIILQAFMKVINYNRIAVQNQSLQDHTEFLFQLMSREIRTAKINYDGECGVDYNQIYKTDDTTLKFLNANDECVTYTFVKPTGGIGQIEVSRQGSSGDPKKATITPQDIDVEAFTASSTQFFIPGSAGRHHPATVHYYIRLNSKIWDPPIMEFTNFITARNSEQF